MALVCDIESASAASVEESKDNTPAPEDNDLEDGEIEDDGEDEEPTPISTVTPPIPVTVPPTEENKTNIVGTPPSNKDKSERGGANDRRHDRSDRRGGRHDDKKKHMTEAEKSILHLRKRERMQREKWEKYRKDQQIEPPVVDDFAINIEKAIASVLKKDKQNSEEEKEEEVKKKGRKRRHRRKGQRFNKQRKLDSPKTEEIDESELLNVRGGSPRLDDHERSPTSHSDESYDSEYSSDLSKSDDRRDRKKENKKASRGRDRSRRRSRDRKTMEQQQPPSFAKDIQGVCVFFLQGKCQKNDCPYSHEAAPPMKLELCKFYLKDCCAKGEKCSYMHGEFPCKFYHTGLVCVSGDNCKFAHGKPLDDHRKQILFKHIETAPREILGGFPRMSREEALNKINIAQQNLSVLYGMTSVEGDKKEPSVPSLFEMNVLTPSETNIDDISNNSKPKLEKPPRNRPSRWQDPDPIDQQQFNFNNTMRDQDMRINSNGDIDMRTLPPPPLAQILSHKTNDEMTVDNDSGSTNFTQDIDIRNPNMLQFDTKDVDIRMDPRVLAAKDVDIRQLPKFDDDDEEPKLQIDTGDNDDLPPMSMPKTQRDLYLRIQSQQKTNMPEPQMFDTNSNDDNNINWYSDDDDEDENRLTIKVDNDDEKIGDIMSPPQIKPQEVVEKLGDLSKIDISAEVTKLLTSITQTAKEIPLASSTKVVSSRDPRQQSRAVTNESDSDKISIYERGIAPEIAEPSSPDHDVMPMESEMRGRPDVDLRNLHLPFKGMLNYTPAKEIDASVNSHPPITWHVQIVDIPRPDYTGLKLNVQEAEKTGDPRLRKIFRLSTEEKDSPASPKASPKASTTAPTTTTTTTRIDPRLKKIEENLNNKQEPTNLTYNQQLNILQSSAFFQSLTSNQKLLLNQELASRNDQNGFHDPVLNSVLSTLNLIPTTNNASNIGGGPNNMGVALNILANVNKLNPAGIVGANHQGGPMVLRQNPNLMNQMAQSIVQPGLLGAAPGIPNLPADFPLNFDPRNGGGLLNNVPAPFANFPPNDNYGNFDDYYQGPPPQHHDNFGSPGGGGGNNRSGGGDNNRNFNNRDRRRGRNNFNRNNGNRNFRNRNNRNNRSHTPP